VENAEWYPDNAATRQLVADQKLVVLGCRHPPHKRRVVSRRPLAIEVQAIVERTARLMTIEELDFMPPAEAMSRVMSHCVEVANKITNQSSLSENGSTGAFLKDVLASLTLEEKFAIHKLPPCPDRRHWREGVSERERPRLLDPGTCSRARRCLAPSRHRPQGPCKVWAFADAEATHLEDRNPRPRMRRFLGRHPIASCALPRKRDLATVSSVRLDEPARMDDRPTSPSLVAWCWLLHP
jgi:hypothetical protein